MRRGEQREATIRNFQVFAHTELSNFTIIRLYLISCRKCLAVLTRNDLTRVSLISN